MEVPYSSLSLTTPRVSVANQSALSMASPMTLSEINRELKSLPCHHRHGHREKKQRRSSDEKGYRVHPCDVYGYWFRRRIDEFLTTAADHRARSVRQGPLHAHYPSFFLDLERISGDTLFRTDRKRRLVNGLEALSYMDDTSDMSHMSAVKSVSLVKSSPRRPADPPTTATRVRKLHRRLLDL